jgi:hypothetical protein
VKRIHWCAVIAVIALSCGAACEVDAAAAAESADPCARLGDLKIDQVQIVSAASQAAGGPVAGANLPGMTGNPGEGALVRGLPAFCRVTGRIHPDPDSDIRFEVWMPSEAWDGRFNGVGTGGFAGSIDYLTLSLALKAGQASASTDTGHSGTSFDSAWAKGHPEKVRDYGWRAIHLTAVTAKKLVATFYGRDPQHAYFIGCSNGGRQGLMEASRFPEDYDGILAGAPAAVWTDVALSMINSTQAQLAPGAAILPEQAHLLQDEVLKQCDALDGQVDGLVDDPRRCQFDASKLACGVSNSPQCFSPAQVTALRRIYAGPRDAAGRQLVAGYSPAGSEVGTPSPMLGWEGYLLAQPDGRPQGERLVDGLLKNLIQEPFATPATFNLSQDPARLKASSASDLDARPNLRRFFDRGGKLILWHGWADAAIPPEATLKFYEAIVRESGPRAQQSAVRLFMVPGVQHCIGGTGPDVFGQLNAPQPGDTPERSMAAAIESWVENDRVPESIVARRGFGGLMGMPAAGPERQRLICAYPAKAVLQVKAKPDAASSYRCVTGSPPQSLSTRGR